MEQPARILIVDDEAAILFTMEAMLQRRGHSVTAAASGEEALQLIAQSSFDLLLLDLKMPGMSGLDVAYRAREIQPEVSILFLTGSSPIEGAVDDLDLHHFDYVIKTAAPQDVLARVAEALAARS